VSIDEVKAVKFENKTRAKTGTAPKATYGGTTIPAKYLKQ